MSLNIFLSQEDAEIFFRKQLNNISEVSLIQNTSEEKPINGEIAWFCKSGGEKFVSQKKGELEAFTQSIFSNYFRTVEKKTGFISNNQFYNYGSKGRISHPKVIDSSSRLRDACDPRLIIKSPLKEKLFRIKHPENDVTINYRFGLFSHHSEKPLISNIAFQEEADFYETSHHSIEIIKPGEVFEFLGFRYYAYSPNNWEICIAQTPRQ